MRRIKPKCRHCGAPVPYMGETCSECASEDHDRDGLDEITRADQLAIMDHMSREDY